MLLKVTVLSCCNRARRLVSETKLQVVKVKIVTCFTTADFVVEFEIVLRKTI